jgi:protein-S-isoprenylcysteine O-methyltransferase Ste14
VIARRVGWLFVAVQVGLLLTLVASSGSTRADWPTPPALRAFAALCTLGGLVVVVVASLQLGRSLTPTPLPNRRGELRTSGLYGVVRHPIYSGLLLVVLGLAVRSASWITAVVAAVTIAFFHVKATWEERQLAQRYPDYPDYAARTGRFAPRVPR